MSLFRRFLVAAAIVFTAGISSALAQSQQLWNRPDISTLVTDLAIIAEKGIALAVIEDGDHGDRDPVQDYENNRYKIAVLDLDSGETLHLIEPLINGQVWSTQIRDIAADPRIIVALKADADSGSGGNFYLSGFDPDSFELLYQVMIAPEEFPDHAPPDAYGTILQIAGDHLLVPAQLRDQYEDLDPVMLVFDLMTGAFIRTIGLQEMDSSAKPGWFGGRPQAPDYFFSTAVVSGSTLFVQGGFEEGKTSGRVLSHDVASGATGPEIAIPDHENRQLILWAADEARLYYALYMPLATRDNVLKQGGLLGVSRQDDQTITTYADPFPVGGETMSLPGFIASNIDTGQRPFIGSYFPGDVGLSGGYVAASVPQMPGHGDAVSGLAVFRAETGEMVDFIFNDPATGREISPLGFALDANALMIALDRGNGAIRNGPYSLNLIRLNAP